MPNPLENEPLMENSGFPIAKGACLQAGRLAIMNLALQGIKADFGPKNADTFLRVISGGRC